MLAPGASVRAAEVSVGDRLPELTIPLSTTLIVATALATRDYELLHHDRDSAHAQGMPDVFMSILASTGFVGRFVTDWAGPDARLRRVALRLGVPNYPGDTLTLRGLVVAREHELVEIDVVGANGIGEHVSAQVRVELPG